MTDDTTTNEQVRAHLSARLMETASAMRRDSILPESEIATAFVTVGTAIAACHNGPTSAAEWLRDMADAIERGDPEIPANLH